MSSQTSVIVIFVCHDKTTVFSALQKVPTATIIFVGDQPIDTETRAVPNIIIARELPNNIESEKKLLTFTAWYLVIMNNLFINYDYICILENDVLLSNTVIEDLHICTLKMCNGVKEESLKEESDIITFSHALSCFNSDISGNVFNECLKIKNIDYDLMRSRIRESGWYPSTNHCLKRSILHDFVHWYYPFCFYIKEKDGEKFSWYHERLLTIYLYNKELTVKVIKGVVHLSNKSHEQTFNKKERVVKMQVT